MSYLVLTRKQGEALVIRAAPDADEQALLEQLRTTGIEVLMVSEGSAKLGIRAPMELEIVRQELLEG
ncbi:hypothetical protein SB18R_03135 [Pseudomonas oryzihabitans]|nr:hypothetical protein SB9_12370 [Pseudomonas psychrotolerans]KTT78242.1 hypothetical protein SB18R_03135 [Pseudomonas psychrotolerans]